MICQTNLLKSQCKRLFSQQIEKKMNLFRLIKSNFSVSCIKNTNTQKSSKFTELPVQNVIFIANRKKNERSLDLFRLINPIVLYRVLIILHRRESLSTTQRHLSVQMYINIQKYVHYHAGIVLIKNHQINAVIVLNVQMSLSIQ